MEGVLWLLFQGQQETLEAPERKRDMLCLVSQEDPSL